jgi:cytochrome oxidase Cu insertion factor (SCO1/SenC/PrrC family)
MSGSNSSVPASAATPNPSSDEPVSFAVHSLPAATLDDDTRRTRIGRIKMLLLLLICASPVVASYFTYYVIRPQARSNYSTLIETPRFLPDASQLSLRDDQQHQLDPRSLRGQWLLIVVADGACDATCEKLLYAQRQLRETLGREKDRLDRVWLVTGAQPPRADLLPALAQATVVQAVPAQVAAWLQPDAGHTLNEHLYLVDPMGYWMMRVPADFDPAKVKRDLDRLLRAAASWDKPGREAL